VILLRITLTFFIDFLIVELELVQSDLWFLDRLELYQIKSSDQPRNLSFGNLCTGLVSGRCFSGRSFSEDVFDDYA